MSDLLTLIAEPWDDYALIDCGGGRKLERYGAATAGEATKSDASELTPS